MLPRSPACCRAVKRQLLQPSDSIWVSDEVLRHVFQRFVNSRTGKRYGSFVPGPLESRRRLGKRRMAHLTESIPTSAQNAGSLWDFFGEADNMQWQWEAPKVRKATGSSAAPLPAWVLDWDTSPIVLPGLAIEEETGKQSEETISVEEDIFGLGRKLQTASSDEMLEICDEFNQRFKQSLRLGLVSEATIYSALNTVSWDIRLAFKESGCESNYRLLSFYQAFWDGLATSKVLQPVDLDPETMNRFLFCLGDLPICVAVQNLFQVIVRAASITQLGRMDRGVDHVVQAWARTWLHEHPPGDSWLLLAEAERTLSQSSTKITPLQELLHSGKNDDLLDLSSIRNAFQEIKGMLDRSLEIIVAAEKVIFPSKASIETLSRVLAYLPRDLLYQQLDSCTLHVIQFHNSLENPATDFLYGWLSLVAKIPHLSDKVFANIIKRMEGCKGAPKHLFLGDVVLSRWISQGYVVKGNLTRNTFELSSLDSGPHDLASVLFAVDKNREKMFCRTKDLFKLLNDLGRYKDVYGVLARMKDLGLKLPRDLIGPTIEMMSRCDLRLAYRIHNLFYSGLICGKGLQPHRNPKFILAMVNDRDCPTPKIWRVMGIPCYSLLPPSKRTKFSGRRLSPATIELVTKLAIAFAHTKARSQRVAFRNVIQCLHHLRRHNAPITPELTRAVSHAGFTRKILNGRWISKELLNWVLGLIEVAEGTEIAVTIDRAVSYWNDRLEEEQQTEALAKAREMNVLRLGPID